MYNQNFSNQTQDAADKARQKNTLQRDIMMKEIDYKRKVNEKIHLEAEIRALKNEEAHIRVSLQEKQNRLSRLEQDNGKMENELSVLRKKMNSL